MATTTTSSTNALAAGAAGRRILGEVEETSLEDVLQRIRTEVKARQTAAAATQIAAHDLTAASVAATHRGGQGTPGGHLSHTKPSVTVNFPIPALEALVARHFHATRALELTIGGSQPLPLLYLLVATLVAAPRRQTVVVVDLEARFDARQLLGVLPVIVTSSSGNQEDGTVAIETPLSEAITEDDLQHVHVFRIDPRWRNAPLAEMISAAEQRVLYGTHRRRDRAWWGTLVVGGAGLGGAGGHAGGHTGGGGKGTLGHGVSAAVVTGYYGWLRVAAQEMDPWMKQRRQKEKLMALLHESEDDDNNDGMGEKLPQGCATQDTVTWIASSPWGSFAFKLQKEPP